jgi:outer membrane protein OmpA-like peptidoglycan-associated protein
MKKTRTMMVPVYKSLLAVAAFCLPAAVLQAQGRTINAIGYTVDGGSTEIDLKNSGLMPGVEGKAKVEAKRGVTMVEAEVNGLKTPSTIGAEFLTFVLWAVSPEGNALNLGELIYQNDGQAKLKTTTQLRSFSLFVTAEPYSAVRQPSELLVLENELRKGTKGRIYPVHNYQMMKRSQYQKLGNPLALTLDLKNVPLEMYEARNAVDIARARGADKYAPDVFAKAEGGLKLAEAALARKANRKEISSLATQTTQFSEDARALTAERQEKERIENERAAAAAAAKAAAEKKAAAEAAVAKQKADEEARRQAELAAAKEALVRAEAAAAKQKADDAARRQADITAAAEAKAKAEADMLRANAEKARLAAQELRAKLLDQFNRILETRDTTRGLVVTMADVLFDTGKYDIKPTTREHLAKLSGILLAHPGLQLEVEGHTDSTGSDELNQKLSEQRASAVRDYMVSNGMANTSVAAKGLGKTMPVAGNETAAGRQKNRRVELIVSGDVIGVKIGQ